MASCRSESCPDILIRNDRTIDHDRPSGHVVGAAGQETNVATSSES
jgi:hypothetical protein